MQVTFDLPVPEKLREKVKSSEFRTFLSQNLESILFEWDLQKSREKAEKTPKSELLNL